MGTYESEVTSCSMIARGNIGANASGPTGSLVAGFRGGSRPKGRSGTRLYQLSGMAFSSSKNFVVSTVQALSSCQHVRYQLTPFARVVRVREPRDGAKEPGRDDLLRQQDYCVSDGPLDVAEVGGTVYEFFAYGQRRRTP